MSRTARHENRKARQMCQRCRDRKARFRYRGHIKADSDHTLCFECYRSEHDRQHARRMLSVHAPILRSSSQIARLSDREVAHRRRMLEHLQRPSAGQVSSQALGRSSCRTRYVSPSRASQCEVPAVVRQPGADNLRDGDATVSKNQCAWRLLAAMARVALDANSGQPLCVHPVTIRL
jgi:hypothetical protein